MWHSSLDGRDCNATCLANIHRTPAVSLDSGVGLRGMDCAGWGWRTHNSCGLLWGFVQIRRKVVHGYHSLITYLWVITAIVIRQIKAIIKMISRWWYPRSLIIYLTLPTHPQLHESVCKNQLGAYNRLVNRHCLLVVGLQCNIFCPNHSTHQGNIGWLDSDGLQWSDVFFAVRTELRNNI